jgi:hypothetical protein
MGIHDLRDLNVCLIASSVQRYHEPNDKLWKSIIDHKYNMQHILPSFFVVSIEIVHPFRKGLCVLLELPK